ncbi:MAG: methyltransferase domain-containing protein [Patescibacteria group bacterium]|nr:methyltransferase domain-containing protein [Patescibacteria group bacterium]
MEAQHKHTEIQNMGENTSKVFSGEAGTKAAREAYNKTPEVFSEEIKKRLLPNKEYTIADIGSFRGELLGKLLELVPDYKFRTIAVDINQDALNKNTLQEKIISDAEHLPFGNGSIDIEVVRFLLQWNHWERQKQIIKEIARTVKEFALVEHGGADNENPDEWREKMDKLFEGVEVPKLKRGEHFFSSRDEIEQMMRDEGIKYERVREKIISDVAEIYSERFGLNEEESAKTRKILSNKNFFVQTDWIIYPQK